MAPSPSIQALLEQSGWIQKLAARLVGDPHVAEDLAQDTWVAALEHQPDPGRPLGAWVTTVLRNNLARLRRRESSREHRERTAESADHAPATLDVVEKAATHRNLVEAVLALDEPYRTTVLLRFFEQRSYRDIARRTKVTTATVNSRLTRGLERLRRRLDREHGGDRQSWVSILVPLAKGSAGLPFTIPGASIMTTSLTLGLVTVAAATTFVVWKPSSEPAPPPQRLAAAPAALSQPAEPALLPAAPLVVEELVESASLATRSPLQVQDEGKKVKEKREWTADFTQTIAQLGTTESVVLNTGSGDIVVEPAQDGNVSFDAKVVADLDRVDPNELTFVLEDHVEVTEEDGTLKIGDAHRGRGWSVNFVLHLPLELSLEANTGSGDVTVREVRSDLMVNTGSGDVRVTGPRTLVTGKLLASTGSGDVEIDVGGVTRSLVGNTGSGDIHARIRNHDSSGEVSLSSGSGDLSLGLPSGASGEFDLETSSGSIRVPASLGLVVEEGRGSTIARGTVGSGGGVYRMSSGSGDIEIRLGEKVGPQ